MILLPLKYLLDNIKMAVVLILVPLIVLVSGSGGWCGDFFSEDTFDFRLLVNDRFHIFNNFYNYDRQNFNRDKNYHIFYVNPYLSTQLGPYMRAVLEIETEFILDMDKRDLDEDTEFRNGYIQCVIPAWKWISFSIGRQAMRTVDGLIYDYQAPAVKGYWDLERGFDVPLKAQTFIAEVSESPYAHAEVKYNFSFLESVTFSYDWFSDNNDGVARIFNRLKNEQIFRSHGRMNWFAVSFEKFLLHFLLKANLIYEKGSIYLRQKDTAEREMDTEGYLVNCSLDYSITKKLLGSLFFYLSSGDKRPEQGTFTSFLSIDPYINKTSIFFNGGFDRQFTGSSHNLGLNGIQLNGVMAPGVVFYYHPTRKISLKSVFAYFFTHRGTAGKGDSYGWETDFMGYYDLNDHWQLIVEFNLFKPGDYFKHITNNRDYTATETILGITYNF